VNASWNSATRHPNQKMGQTPTLLLKTNAERNTRASGAMQHKKKMRDARRQACFEWKEESDFPSSLSLRTTRAPIGYYMQHVPFFQQVQNLI